MSGLEERSPQKGRKPRSAAEEVSASEADRNVVALPGRDVQRLWLVLQRQAWRSLVLAPVRKGGSARPLAEALARVGAGLGLPCVPLRLIAAEGLELGRALRLADEIGAGLSLGSRVIAFVDPVQESPGAAALARTADAVLLCVEVGEADLDSVRQAVAQVGRERVVGCAAVHPGGRR